MNSVVPNNTNLAQSHAVTGLGESDLVFIQLPTQLPLDALPLRSGPGIPGMSVDADSLAAAEGAKGAQVCLRFLALPACPGWLVSTAHTR